MDARPESRKVREVMSSPPVSVGPRTPVAELLRIFHDSDFNAVPVVDEGRWLHGIVTKLDVLRLFRPDPRRHVPDVHSPGAAQVGDIMRRGVVTLEPDDPLVAAVDLMLEAKLRSLPVVERPRGGGPVLVGMVSRGDLLRALGGASPEEDPGSA